MFGRQKIEKPPKMLILGGFVIVLAGLVVATFDPFVICLGLEPRTPSLKGMCSTC